MRAELLTTHSTNITRAQRGWQQSTLDLRPTCSNHWCDRVHKEVRGWLPTNSPRAVVTSNEVVIEVSSDLYESLQRLAPSSTTVNHVYNTAMQRFKIQDSPPPPVEFWHGSACNWRDHPWMPLVLKYLHYHPVLL